MFTGLVEEVGVCRSIVRVEGGARLLVAGAVVSPGVEVGDSIAVNGCCLTVTSHSGTDLGFDLLDETLRCTNLGELQDNSRVNLERPLAAGGRLGGHFVQGHVDATAEVLEVEKDGANLKIVMTIPPACIRYVAYKGSVAVNGVSLTVAAAGEDSFTVWIIPHTRTATNLGDLLPGAKINLEADILAKYIERLLTHCISGETAPQAGDGNLF